MQKVERKPCDVEGCDQPSTSYSSGHGRWCEKHSPLPNFNPDLKGRREGLKERIRSHLCDWCASDEIAEKILQELNL